jgi:hypothetical protein
MAQPNNEDADLGLLRSLFEDLTELDERVMDVAQEAIDRTENTTTFPITQVDLTNIRRSHLDVEKSDYSLPTVVKYTLNLPKWKSHWLATSRGILNLYSMTRIEREPEWGFWVDQIERAGKKACLSALAACPSVVKYGEVRAWNAVVERFSIADDLLDRISNSGVEREKFAVELNDTM